MKTKLIGLFLMGATSLVQAQSPELWSGLSAAPQEHEHHHIDYHKARHLVNLLYRAILFREAEEAGLHGWAQGVVQGGFSAYVNFAGQIANSPEYLNNVRPNHRAHEIANNFYLQLLDRPAEEAALHNGARLIREGQQAAFVQGIVNSPEFRQKHHID